MEKMRFKKDFREEVSSELSIENGKCSTVGLQGKCLLSRRNTVSKNAEEWNKRIYRKRKVSCLLWLTWRVELVVGKKENYKMKDKTEEMDRGHVMERFWILTHRYSGAIIDFVIRERHNQIWVLESSLWWYCEDESLWDKWSRGRMISKKTLMQIREFEGLNQGGRDRYAGKNLKFDTFGKWKWANYTWRMRKKRIWE